MFSTVKVSAIQIHGVTDLDRKSGLIAYASFVINDLFRIGGATIRLTLEGEPRLTFPGRRDKHDIEHPYLIPLNEAIRKEIEFQVLRALKEGDFLTTNKRGQNSQ